MKVSYLSLLFLALGALASNDTIEVLAKTSSAEFFTLASAPQQLFIAMKEEPEIGPSQGRLWVLNNQNKVTEWKLPRKELILSMFFQKGRFLIIQEEQSSRGRGLIVSTWMAKSKKKIQEKRISCHSLISYQWKAGEFRFRCEARAVGENAPMKSTKTMKATGWEPTGRLPVVRKEIKTQTGNAKIDGLLMDEIKVQTGKATTLKIKSSQP